MSSLPQWVAVGVLAYTAYLFVINPIIVHRRRVAARQATKSSPTMVPSADPARQALREWIAARRGWRQASKHQWVLDSDDEHLVITYCANEVNAYELERSRRGQAAVQISYHPTMLDAIEAER